MYSCTCTFKVISTYLYVCAHGPSAVSSYRMTWGSRYICMDGPLYASLYDSKTMTNVGTYKLIDDNVNTIHLVSLSAGYVW